MFDIGFPELIIVGIVALLVIGPEKLPDTIRTIAQWVARIKRSLANIKLELENEIGADEIRAQIHNESIMKDLNETRADLNKIVNETNTSLSDIKASTAHTSGDRDAVDSTDTNPDSVISDNSDPNNSSKHDGPKQSKPGG